MSPAALFFERWKWALATIAVVLGVFMGAVAHEEVWAWLGVWHLTPYFADLAAIFAAGEAWMVGRDVYLINPFDPLGRPHVYGPWWLATGPLGLSVADARWAGALLVLVFVVVAVAMMRPRTPGAALATTLFLVSGPVMLGLERANNDLIVVVLLAAAAWLIGRGGWAARAGGGVLALAAGLKIYPVVALTALGAMRRRVCFASIGLAAAACGLAFWVWREDFRHILVLAPRPMTVFSYGIRNLYYSWVGFVELRAFYLVPFLLAGGAAGWGLWSARRGLWRMVPLEGGAAAAHVAGASSWVFCFLGNSNYPYRVVLMALCARLWLRETDEADAPERRAGRRMLMLVILASLLATPKMWWSVVNEGGVEMDASVRWVIGLAGADQAIWLVVTAGLAASLAGWTWRWLKARRYAWPAGRD